MNYCTIVSANCNSRDGGAYMGRGRERTQAKEMGTLHATNSAWKQGHGTTNACSELEFLNKMLNPGILESRDLR